MWWPATFPKVSDRAGGPVSAVARRVLFAHAHPDDETLSTGVAIAQSVARGDQVTVLTCTLGEEGEIIPKPLRHLASNADDTLGRHRAGELAAAMRELGVGDHRLLAGGRWRDSGMVWLAPGQAGAVGGDVAGFGAAVARLHPAAFSRADVDVAAGEVAAVIRQVRPQVVVTYDPQGGYGHPDHVMTHRVTTRAIELAKATAEPEPAAVAGESASASAGWDVGAVYWVQVPRSWADEERRLVHAAAAAGQLPSPLRPPQPDAQHPAAVVDDDELDVVLRATPAEFAAVQAALRAHESQLQVVPPWFAASDEVAARLWTVEGFRRVQGPPIPATARPADDLFAGLDLTGG